MGQVSVICSPVPLQHLHAYLFKVGDEDGNAGAQVCCNLEPHWSPGNAVPLVSLGNAAVNTTASQTQVTVNVPLGTQRGTTWSSAQLTTPTLRNTSVNLTHHPLPLLQQLLASLLSGLAWPTSGRVNMSGDVTP